ncbi:shikimate dehydrogenase [Chroococcidiopsis thermalis]|uniref:Shikimate dehydrogenase (NADP(+)) n=1 Tax=Chroococcidiopsis thermalis (strain PCC 7203) TaxID=251229 RepID=K9TYB7_CHRTP|nr:shikimate dehydrogenase [Chroococcidiopsis thermalis]AFY87802.1 shikimate dehydrogenase [Chroococcidiopsis thermalis PCC 7203]
MITGKTKLLGVIGHPVEHSLSPAMHNAAIAHLGLDYVYLPLPVKPEDLAAALQGFAAIGLVGFNATIPHKQAILPFLSEVSPVAQAVGAVNTVWRTDEGWAGTNTDVEGFLAPLLEKSKVKSQKSKIDSPDSPQIAVILGNGGAARAVVAGCSQLGCAEICVVGRNEVKLQEFYTSWSNSQVQANLQVYTWDKLPDLIARADLLVNTTPIGMYPHVDRSPLSLSEMAVLKQGAIAYDLIYTPRPTLFLQQAQQQGARTIDGLEMLVQQGAAALKIWLQQPVPVEIMRQALQQQL